MREAIKKHFDWDESRSESEIEGAVINHFTEADKLHVPVVSDWKCHNKFLQMEELWSNMREESIKLKDDLANTECGKELEGRLELEISKNESLMIQLQESEKTIESLQVEVEILSQSKRIIEDQFEILKKLKEDPNTQLTAAEAELNKAREKLSFLEEELDNKNIFSKELEATCLDLQLQLESMTKKEILKYNSGDEEKQLQNSLEITAASEKLAECQETILNLGRQLQAMASPRDASLFDKVICTPAAITTMNNPKKNKTTLLDKMLAEDNAETGYPRSPKTKEIICTPKSPTMVDDTSNSAFRLHCATDSAESFLNSNAIKHQDGQVVVNSLAIIPGKRKGGGGLWKKLLWRQKGRSKKPHFPYAA